MEENELVLIEKISIRGKEAGLIEPSRIVLSTNKNHLLVIKVYEEGSLFIFRLLTEEGK